MRLQTANGEWSARSDGGGPGLGVWCPEVVRVDESGFVRLLAGRIEGQWYQSEVVSRELASYGRHRFHVISRLDQLHPAAVVGLFLYRDDAHEIDIEFSRGFGREGDLGHYAVQPCGAGRSHSFPLELSGQFTTHEIDWAPERVRFASWHGHSERGPADGWIEQWHYEGRGIPSEDDRLRVRMNLWLLEKNAPASPQEVAVRYAKE